jgi:hypothetical protein
MCKYAENPLTYGETTIYKYIHLTVSMVGDVVVSRDVAPISGALFAKKALRLSRQLGG